MFFGEGCQFICDLFDGNGNLKHWDDIKPHHSIDEKYKFIYSSNSFEI